MSGLRAGTLRRSSQYVFVSFIVVISIKGEEFVLPYRDAILINSKLLKHISFLFSSVSFKYFIVNPSRQARI